MLVLLYREGGNVLMFGRQKESLLGLTLLRSGGYQIDTCLPFSLYWLHGFHSESEQPDWNRVKYILLWEGGTI